MRRAIREHARDFAAIVGLVVIALAVTLVILNQQRLSLPGWVPLLGEERFELKAELSSAQAVTPGQGQTVNIAGIRVGDVSQVDLEDGAAVVTMQIDEEYASLVHDDASILLRPKTGLQDMTLELDPGTGGEEVEEGSTIPLASTQPNVNPDQILAALDADTRDYLTLLLEGGAKGLGDGRELSATLRRFEPTARDLNRISGALAKRQANLRHAIHEFRLVSETLGDRDTQLADFVSSSNAVMASFARQEASLRESFQELPGALGQTRDALSSADALALELGPALTALRPAARALQPALEATQPFFRDTRGPIRNQIRPFARRVQPTVADLTKASNALGRSTPPLTRGLTDLNALLNGLAFNPGGPQEEGYLFWASWLNHLNNSIFLTQDGGGPLRRGLVMASCQQSRLAYGSVGRGQPFLATLSLLTRFPTPTEINTAIQPQANCPITPPGP